MMRKEAAVFVACAFLLAFAISPVFGGTLVLRGGTKITGEVTDLGSSYQVKLADGSSINVQKALVASTEGVKGKAEATVIAGKDAWKLSLEKKLRAPCQVSFEEPVPFSDVVALLQDAGEVTITYNKQYIQDDTLLPPLKPQEGMTLGNVIKWVANGVGGKMVLKDGAVYISTEYDPDFVTAYYQMKTYDANDLMLLVQDAGVKSAIFPDLVFGGGISQGATISGGKSGSSGSSIFGGSSNSSGGRSSSSSSSSNSRSGGRSSSNSSGNDDDDDDLNLQDRGRDLLRFIMTVTDRQMWKQQDAEFVFGRGNTSSNNSDDDNNSSGNNNSGGGDDSW